MATATKSQPSHFDATEQFTQFGERFTESGKRVGNLYLDSYDKLVEQVTSLQTKLAEQSHNDTVKSAVGTQVDVTRQMASAYSSAARELLA